MANLADPLRQLRDERERTMEMMRRAERVHPGLFGEELQANWAVDATTLHTAPRAITETTVAKATEPAHAGCKTAQVRARKHRSQLATAEDVAVADTAAQVAHRLKARAYRAITSGGQDVDGQGSAVAANLARKEVVGPCSTGAPMDLVEELKSQVAALMKTVRDAESRAQEAISVANTLQLQLDYFRSATSRLLALQG